MKRSLSIFLLLILIFFVGCGKQVEEFFPHSVSPDRELYSAVKIPKDPNDPYSVVIEQYYQKVLDESTDVQDALKYSRYTVYDIDGDGTKELLLSCAHSPEEKMNRNMFLEHIFSVKDGTAFEVKIPNNLFPNSEYLGETDVSGRYVFPNGLLQINANRNTCFFRYANGALSYVNDFVYKASETDSPYEYHYMCYAPDENGKRQFKEEMIAGDASDMLRELRNGEQCVDLIWLPLESYGRLKQAEDYYSVIVKDKRDELFKNYEYNKKSELSDDQNTEIYALDNFKRHLYAFYDIDGDGTQELLLSQNKYLWGYEEDEFYDSSIPLTKGIVLEHIYSFNGEGVKEVTYNVIPQWRWDGYFAYSTGGRDILTNGIVRYYGGSPEHTSYAYFRYSDGELKFIKALRYYEGPETWLISDNNGEDVKEKITQKDFDRIKAEIEDGAKVADIQWQMVINYGQ